MVSKHRCYQCSYVLSRVVAIVPNFGFLFWVFFLLLSDKNANYVDDWCLGNLLQGMCYRCMRKPTEALESMLNAVQRLVVNQVEYGYVSTACRLKGLVAFHFMRCYWQFVYTVPWYTSYGWSLTASAIFPLHSRGTRQGNITDDHLVYRN